MSPRLVKRGRIWSAWVPKPGGGTRLVTTNCTDPKAAALRAAELERDALDPTRAAANKATTQAGCERFVESRKRAGRAEGTLHHYGVKLSHAVRLLPAMLRDVSDSSVLEKYADTREAEGAARTTVKKELRAIGAMLRHAKRKKLWLGDLDEVMPEYGDDYKPRKRALTPLEFVGLCLALPSERAAHVAFIVATGARWSESVRAERIDCHDRVVHLRGTKTESSDRDVPIPPHVRGVYAWALARAPGDGRLFHHWQNVRRDLALACGKAGIAAVTPNDLRRTFATWLVEGGVATNLVGNAMGHTTSRMVERVYGRVSPGALGKLLEETMGKTTVEYTSGADAQNGAESVPETTQADPGEPPASAGITAEMRRAQGRNRTADTGIFSPGGTAATPEENEDSGPPRRAYVLPWCPACTPAKCYRIKENGCVVEIGVAS